MSERAYNFSAGPAALPEPVIQQAQKDLWDWNGCGMGVCELSHRGPEYDQILAEAFADCRAIGAVPDEFEIIFMQGGATMQADMVPMSWLHGGKKGEYLDTGKWAADAIKEAGYYAKLYGGSVHVAGSTKAENYCRLPRNEECDFAGDAAYCLYVSNNTIYGTRFVDPPAAKAPIIADTSSEMFSRPLDYAKHAMFYAGAQKNLGPSGQVLILVRKDFLAKAPRDVVGRMFDYNIAAEKESRFNTPNTFAVYLMGQTFKWLLREFGSLAEVDRHNREKAAIIYDVLDASDFYQGHVTEPADRSLMNISFKCPTPELDAQFLKGAAVQGLLTLKGHRSTGGMRASIYNAFPLEGCRKLAEFMKSFEREHKSEHKGHREGTTAATSA